MYDIRLRDLIKWHELESQNREASRRGFYIQTRWLASMLADEKAVTPVLKYLKTTEIGGREGARERELEWERKTDQAGEDLLE